IEEAVGELSRAIEDIRRYVGGLRPAQFTGDLTESLERLVEVFGASADLEVAAELEEAPPLDEEAASSLFHIAQEALSNVRRHAEAEHVRIELRNGSDRCELVISDDGQGFEMGPMSEQHMGLRNMRLRARAAGGDLQIE